MGMLKDVVDEGTGSRPGSRATRLPERRGLRSKPDGKGGYSNKYVASFVGIVPASNPSLVIMVTVDNPRRTIWGGVVAAPAVRQIALDCLSYLEIPPDKPS